MAGKSEGAAKSGRGFIAPGEEHNRQARAPRDGFLGHPSGDVFRWPTASSIHQHLGRTYEPELRNFRGRALSRGDAEIAGNFLDITERQGVAPLPFQSLRWKFGFQDERTRQALKRADRRLSLPLRASSGPAETPPAPGALTGMSGAFGAPEQPRGAVSGCRPGWGGGVQKNGRAVISKQIPAPSAVLSQ
jgi:hypothetical protein